jgi:hypothetical protein
MKYILIALVLLSCSKKDDNGRVTFYNITDNSVSPHLYVNGKKLGLLRTVPQQPVCGDKVDTKIITIELPYGEYTMEIMNSSKTKGKQYFTVDEKCKTVRVD